MAVLEKDELLSRRRRLQATGLLLKPETLTRRRFTLFEKPL
jgi:hypothetical protein